MKNLNEILINNIDNRYSTKKITHPLIFGQYGYDKKN
jgi:hypothetical protein